MNAIPGTSFNYKCSTGFGVADESNPDQVLSCTANFKVEGLDAIQICEGKTRKDKKLCATYLSYFSSRMPSPDHKHGHY